MIPAEVETLRAEIDEIDNLLYEFIEKRLITSRQIQAIKRRMGITVYDMAREEEILKQAPSLIAYHVMADLIRLGRDG